MWRDEEDEEEDFEGGFEEVEEVLFAVAEGGKTLAVGAGEKSSSERKSWTEADRFDSRSDLLRAYLSE